MENKKRKRKGRKKIQIPGVDWDRVTITEIKERKKSCRGNPKGGPK